MNKLSIVCKSFTSSIVAVNQFKMPVIVITDHPSDFPDYYVARMWEGTNHSKQILLDTSLEQLVSRLPKEFVKMDISSSEDPVIVAIYVHQNMLK